MKIQAEDDPIFVVYQGNRISWKLKVYFDDEKYKLVFQKFHRTQPTQEQRIQGMKKKRILLSQKIYFFSNLINIETIKLPSASLATEFLKLNLS